MNIKLLSLSVFLLLSACASAPTKSPSALVEGGRCSVHVYRTQTVFHSLNPEKPFIYVGEEQVGQLGVGDTLCLRLPAGRYIVSVRESVLFMPAYPSGKVEIEVTADSVHYVRYAKNMGGVIGMPSGPVVTGNLRFGLSNEQGWRARQ
jgi:hypothetical protein